MTDPRRQSIAALQGSPDPRALAITHAVLCRPQSPIVLDQIAALCGATGRPYSASVDPGRPWAADTTSAPSGQHSGATALNER